MSQFFRDTNAVPAMSINTLSAEGGAATPPNGNNFNISGTVAGGYGSNGAIVFSTVNPGELNAQVQVDNTTITINAANQLQALGGTSGTATTVGAATSTISLTVPIPNNSCTSIIMNVVGYDVGAGVGCGGESIGLIRNVAGVLTVIDTVDTTRNNDNVLDDWDVALSSSGTNAIINVTGVLGYTINWRATVETVNAP